jgi:hypothetical protein
MQHFGFITLGNVLGLYLLRLILPALDNYQNRRSRDPLVGYKAAQHDALQAYLAALKAARAALAAARARVAYQAPAASEVVRGRPSARGIAAAEEIFRADVAAAEGPFQAALADAEAAFHVAARAAARRKTAQ